MTAKLHVPLDGATLASGLEETLQRGTVGRGIKLSSLILSSMTQINAGNFASAPTEVDGVVTMQHKSATNTAPLSGCPGLIIAVGSGAFDFSCRIKMYDCTQNYEGPILAFWPDFVGAPNTVAIQYAQRSDRFDGQQRFVAGGNVYAVNTFWSAGPPFPPLDLYCRFTRDSGGTLIGYVKRYLADSWTAIGSDASGSTAAGSIGVAVYTLHANATMFRVEISELSGWGFNTWSAASPVATLASIPWTSEINPAGAELAFTVDGVPGADTDTNVKIAYGVDGGGLGSYMTLDAYKDLPPFTPAASVEFGLQFNGDGTQLVQAYDFSGGSVVSSPEPAAAPDKATAVSADSPGDKVFDLNFTTPALCDRMFLAFGGTAQEAADAANAGPDSVGRIFLEDFEDGTIGEDPAGWVVSETGGEVSVESSAGLDMTGSKCLMINKTTPALSISAARLFTEQSAPETLVVNFLVRFAETDRISNFYMGNAGEYNLRLKWKSDGLIYYKNSSNNYISTGVAYSADVTYHYRVIYRIGASAFDLFIDDVLIGTFSTVSRSTIDRARWFKDTADVDGTMHVDDVDVSAVLPVIWESLSAESGYALAVTELSSGLGLANGKTYYVIPVPGNSDGVFHSGDYAEEDAVSATPAYDSTDPGAAFVVRQADGGPASYQIEGVTKIPAFNLAAANTAYSEAQNDALDPAKLLTTYHPKNRGATVDGLFVEPPQNEVKLGTPVGVQ